MGRLPEHGTVGRYRIELRDESVCDRCRAGNARAKAKERANRKARDQRSHMAIVPDPQDEPTQDTPAAVAEPGVMEKAVVEDLAEVEESERVAFHRSLSALALQLAREVDGETAATARSAASKQLFDVLKSLRAGRGADASTALDIVLEDFGLPLVSDGSA